MPEHGLDLRAQWDSFSQLLQYAESPPALLSEYHLYSWTTEMRHICQDKQGENTSWPLPIQYEKLLQRKCVLRHTT